MDDIFFSIIVPLYNKEKFILNTINSIFRQSYTSYEIIIIDDGSTDSGRQIVESIGSPKIKIVRQTNSGPSVARNTGVLEAKSKWILFLDADDELLPNCLQLFNDAINKWGDSYCYVANFYVEESNGRRYLFSQTYRMGKIENNFKAWFCRYCFIRTGASVIRRDVLLELPFNISIRRYEDAEHNFRLSENCDFITIKDPVMLYKQYSLEASCRKENIAEDFLGSLILPYGNFWKIMLYYKFYLEAIRTYPIETWDMYKNFRKDKWYLFLAKILCSKIVEKLILLIRF